MASTITYDPDWKNDGSSVLLDTGSRDLTPWYRMRDLVGSNTYATESGPVEAENLIEGWEAFTEEYDPLETDFSIVRYLPQDTYLPPEDVIATLTAAIWWGKAVNVSWMEMQYRSTRDAEVPIQEHRNGAAVMYVDDSLVEFGIAGPDDLDGPVKIAMDCVTDITLANVVPEPDPLGPRADEHLMSRLLAMGTRQEYDYISGLKRDGDEHWRVLAQHIIDSATRGVVPTASDDLVPQVDG